MSAAPLGHRISAPLLALLVACGSSRPSSKDAPDVPVTDEGPTAGTAPTPPGGPGPGPTAGAPAVPSIDGGTDAGAAGPVDAGGPVVEVASPAQLVDTLDIDRFRSNVETLAAFGTRHYAHPGNAEARDWIQAQFESYGYVTERHTYQYEGNPIDSVYATKVGVERPDQMYILSAHLDSFNLDNFSGAFAPGADDNASGTSLVLEAARVFGQQGVNTGASIRFILWNNEETGLDGSNTYAAGRRALQGVEDPPGSGKYPEPTWLGIIQHDMIMFDHGNPPGPEQSPNADIDIEYQRSALMAPEAEALADALFAGNAAYSTDYPAEVGDRMSNTDSASFEDLCPAVSVRENEREAEIGTGSNPHWHQDSDVAATYSDADFRLGFNAAQMTVGTVAELVGLK